MHIHICRDVHQKCPYTGDIVMFVIEKRLLLLSETLLHIFLVFIAINNPFHQVEDMLKHIPHEVLLGKENVQLSDVIGQGIFLYMHV